MAREYIKTSAGLFPVGDTQGLFVSQIMRYCRVSQNGDHLSGADSIPLIYQNGENWSFESTKIKIPETGLYFLTASCYFVMPVGGRTDVCFKLNNQTIKDGELTDLMQGASGFNAYSHIQTILPLNSGDLIEIIAGLDGTPVSVNSTKLTAVLLQQQTPYMIANKGSLVSSNNYNEVTIDSSNGTMRVNQSYSAIGVGKDSTVSGDFEDGDGFTFNNTTGAFIINLASTKSIKLIGITKGGDPLLINKNSLSEFINLLGGSSIFDVYISSGQAVKGFHVNVFQNPGNSALITVLRSL
jgi:hypothetical protein